MISQCISTVQAKVWLCYLHRLRRIGVSFNILREVCAYLYSLCFPSVSGNKVCLYDIETGIVTEHLITVKFKRSSFVEIDATTVFCIGNTPASNEMYSLDLTTMRLTPLPALHTARDRPGVVKGEGQHTDSVYVFGGYAYPGYLTSCEKYAVREGKWRDLGNMRYRRCYFTPCTFKVRIYLVSTYKLGVRAIETFDPDTDTFEKLSISLPREVEYGCASVTFVTQGELVLLTAGKQMARWRIETELEFRVFRVDRQCCSTQPPLVLDSLVLIAHSGQVETFSLESFTFI